MRQANALTALAESVGASIHQNNLTAIRESQMAAQNDIIRGEIDPERQTNDASYAATILRNDMQKDFQGLTAELENPQSAHANMDPVEYEKMLQEQSKRFYKNNKGPHAESLSEMYSRYHMANQPGLIAAQAKIYKDNMKVKQGIAATEALTGLPVSKDIQAFKANTGALFAEMLPPDRFSSQERLNIGMAAATAAAGNGDRRLLDYMKTHYDAEVFAASGVATAESMHKKYMQRSQDNAYGEARINYENQALEGTFTDKTWNDLMRDQEAVRRWGASTINRWRLDSRKNHRKEKTLGDAVFAIRNKRPVIGLKPEEYQAADDAVLEGIMQQHAGNPAIAWGHYWNLRTHQGEFVNKRLKTMAQSYMNAGRWTTEAVKDPQFEQAFTAMSIAQEQLTPQQFTDQFGKDAAENFMVLEQYVNAAGGDFEKALIDYKEAQSLKKDIKIGVPKLSLEEQAEIDGFVEELIEGTADGSDPNVKNKWGWIPFVDDTKSQNAMFTQELKAEYNKAMTRLVTEKGMDVNVAAKAAQAEIASRFRWFGNEWHNTEGVPMWQHLGFNKAVGNDDMQKAFELFAAEVGLNHEEAHVQLRGNEIWVTDNEGTRIGVPVPKATIGSLWTEHTRQAQEDNDDGDLTVRNSYTEAVMQASIRNANDPVLKSGVTLKQFQEAGEDQRLVWRNQFWAERTEFRRRLMKPIVEFFKQARSNAAELAEYGHLLDQPRPYFTEAEKKQLQRDYQGVGIKDITDPTPRQQQQQQQQQETQNTKTPAAKQLMRHEGFRGKPYKDTEGVLTIGYGRNLEANPLTPEEEDRLGVGRDFNKQPLTKEEAEYLFANDLRQATGEAQTHYKAIWNNLSQARQDVLVNMTFNLGIGKLSNFVKMEQALIDQDYDKAADEMVDSKWYRQVKSRGKELVAQMRKG
jgi:lysozyme